jgi:hypothetical protein
VHRCAKCSAQREHVKPWSDPVSKVASERDKVTVCSAAAGQWQADSKRHTNKLGGFIALGTEAVWLVCPC